MKIEYECRCKACGGTGIYVGLGERDGWGVQCYKCRGVGRVFVSIEYEPFDGRVLRDNVHTVLQTNPGICVGSGLDETFGGVSYDEWITQDKFPEGVEMRSFTCPAWWYQGADYSRKPQWDECIGCGSFSACNRFSTKDYCWNRFDKEEQDDS